MPTYQTGSSGSSRRRGRPRLRQQAPDTGLSPLPNPRVSGCRSLRTAMMHVNELIGPPRARTSVHTRPHLAISSRMARARRRQCSDASRPRITAAQWHRAITNQESGNQASDSLRPAGNLPPPLSPPRPTCRLRSSLRTSRRQDRPRYVRRTDSADCMTARPWTMAAPVMVPSSQRTRYSTDFAACMETFSSFWNKASSARISFHHAPYGTSQPQEARSMRTCKQLPPRP
ncbi:hypothetical protein C8T65DRAFT_270488 [Cerioporus squamosus]|nr:hypothetical protein C8T65DRAFT_270488 [Cerioporus squamosus]